MIHERIARAAWEKFSGPAPAELGSWGELSERERELWIGVADAVLQVLGGELAARVAELERRAQKNEEIDDRLIANLGSVTEIVASIRGALEAIDKRIDRLESRE
jgi:hypothetical protein